jgi:transposase
MSCAKLVSHIEVLPAGDLGRRRDWSDAEKIRIVEESLQGHRQGSATARRYGLSRPLLTAWRRQYRSGDLVGMSAHGFMPLTLSPPEADPRELVLQPQPDTDMQIEISLTNGRRLTIPARLDPDILARLLPVLERS